MSDEENVITFDSAVKIIRDYADRYYGSQDYNKDNPIEGFLVYLTNNRRYRSKQYWKNKISEHDLMGELKEKLVT